MKKTIGLAAILLLLPALAFAAEDSARPKLIYFYTPDCHKCAEIKAGTMPGIEKDLGGRISIEYRDISDPDNYMLLFELKQKAGGSEKAVFPVLYLEGRFLDAGENTRDARSVILAFIESSLAGTQNSKTPVAPARDVRGYLKSLGPWSIAAAGLVDGINPCAFTVIVFFISFLFLQGYEKRTIILSGVSFITAVFLTYILIGLGLFGSLYAIKGFWGITRAITIFVATLSVGLGIVTLYDAIRFLITKDPHGAILKLPESVKTRIHTSIGDQYRAKGGRSAGPDCGALKAVLVAMSAGFTVSLLESICTGQLYLPAIIYVLKTSPQKMFALGYLVLYNLMFIIPLFIVFLLAIGGASAQSFSNFMKKHFFLIKLLMAALFLVLGASLAFADTGKETTAVEASRKNDPYFHDFGRVKEGIVLKHRFMLKNDSSEPLNIKQVNASCACTTSKISTKTVLPGKKVPIEIAFDTKGYPGTRNRYLFVHTDSSKTPIIILEIRADVEKEVK